MNVHEKLSAAVVSDRAGAVETVLRVLKSDFCSTLAEYAVVDPQSLQATADVQENDIRITVSATVSGIKSIGKILP